MISTRHTSVQKLLASRYAHKMISIFMDPMHHSHSFVSAIWEPLYSRRFEKEERLYLCPTSRQPVMVILSCA